MPDIGIIKWTSTASKTVSTKFKLEHTKKYLRSLKKKYPGLFKKRKIDTGNYNQEMIDLIRSYNDILVLSGYTESLVGNLVIIPEVKDMLKEDTTGLSDTEIQTLHSITIGNSNNRNQTTKLPAECGVTVNMIPKYCYFSPESKWHGGSFKIDRNHPQMNGKRWTTTTSKKVSISDKFKQLTKHLNSLA